MTLPRVSVVIPTRDRPRLVLRAVQSVLCQTLGEFEIVVIQHGEDAVTAEALRSIDDPRLSVHVAPPGGGPGAARNFGVARARAEWIAFLDDDDEMLPERLEKQLAAASACAAAYPVVSSRGLVRSESGDALLPERLPYAGEHLSDYLFVKKGIIGEGGGVGTTLVFTKKELLERLPFPTLSRHEDWSWALRTAATSGCEWLFVPDPLVVIYYENARQSLSRTGVEWIYSFDWARDHRTLMTDRAYVSFLLSTVARIARQQSAFGAVPKILGEALQAGSPSLLDWMIFASIWVLRPTTFRFAQRLRTRRRLTRVPRVSDGVP